MNTIKVDQKRLDNIAKAYHKTGGEVREMWKNKWYELVRQIGRRSCRSIRYIRVKSGKLLRSISRCPSADCKSIQYYSS